MILGNLDYKNLLAPQRQNVPHVCILFLIKDIENGKTTHGKHIIVINNDIQHEFYLHRKVIFGPKQCICSTCYALSDADKAISDDAIEEMQMDTHSFT